MRSLPSGTSPTVPYTWDAAGFVGSLVGGAIAGATTAVAGPLGGTIAGAAGFTTAGSVAAAVTVGISAVGGATATEVASLISTGRDAAPAELLQGALLNGAGGYLSGVAYPLKGVSTALQASLFAPRSWASLARGEPY